MHVIYLCMNFIHAKRYVNIKICKEIELTKHIRPIMVFFATSIAVVIYVNSDTTILGFLCSDETVGIYSVSVNVYKALKTVFSAVIVVSIPRMSMLWGSNRKEDFAYLGKDIYQTFLTIVFPAVFGVIILSKEIVFLLSGSGFESAQRSLIILSVSLFFCLGAGFWSQGVLIPQGKEQLVFLITVVSALINVGLNFILIPVWNENAAALTTLIAEVVVFFYCREKGRQTIQMEGTAFLLLKVFAGCFPMFFIYRMIFKLGFNWIIRMTLVIVACVAEYVIIECLLKNSVLVEYTKKIRNKRSFQLNN